MDSTGNGKPSLPKLPHPSATPRIGYGGAAERDRPVFEQKGGEGKTAWSVVVTPLVGAGGLVDGLQLGGGRHKPRAVFEIAATYVGRGLEAFGSVEGTTLIETTRQEDEEVALRIARVVTEQLRQGNREIDLNAVAKRVKGTKAG